MKILKKFHGHKKNKSGVSKNLFFIALLFLMSISTATYAQSESGFGIKVGLNYNGNGDYVESINSNVKQPERNVGYHLGVFGKFGEDLYLKPELVYTATKSDYTDDSFKMKKLDAPILVGTKVFGPLSVFAGPSFQYILDSDFKASGLSIDKIKNDFSVGLNFGVGFNLKRLGVDVRYERGFSKNEASFLDNNGVTVDGGRLDTRPSQIILSLSFLL